MSDAVKGKQLVERYNRFVEYSNKRKENTVPFEQKLTEITDQPKERQEQPKARQEQPKARQEATPHATMRGARRYQPPKLARPKDITMVQAQRLARLAPLIADAARRNDVPIPIICGVILQESGGNPRAVSSAGAKGLMQLMPGTAKRFGVRDPFDPQQNIEGGTKYLRWLLDRFGGNIELALAGYNAGEGNVEKYGMKVPPFSETRAYIPNVLGYTQAMINALYAGTKEELPQYARKV
jgi:soluble lytic murein transglycosylase-like protein